VGLHRRRSARRAVALALDGRSAGGRPARGVRAGRHHRADAHRRHHRGAQGR
jgi:hypothetical protein